MICSSGGATPNPSSKAITLLCANILNGRYRYTDDLLQLAATSVYPPSHSWPRYYTPLLMENLRPFLAGLPDQAFTAYMHDGLTMGFRIGYAGHGASPHSCGRNHPSSLANEEVVLKRIAAEVTAGRLHGPLPAHLLPQVHVSPMGLVPKAHMANKWRLIVNLSHPTGSSGISSNLCSLHYASVDDAVDIIKKLGRGTQLVKLDVKDAYRIVPVHPSDYHLLGIRWRDRTYVDRALPFGRRSAPKFFSALADLVAWVLDQQGIRHQLHYLDDFLFLGAPDSLQGAESLAIALRVFEGPTTVLVFLGILIDTQAFELRLPVDKLARMQETICSWVGKKACTRKELESLLGHLSHAAAVISQGRTFLRQLFPLLSVGKSPHYFVRLNAGARADLLWWNVFLQDWNGTSFFPTSVPAMEVISDASGTYGCGAFSLPHGWFQLEWPESWLPVHITAKELLPIVIAAGLWGNQWKCKCICFRSDNMAVVDILKSRTSRDQPLMHLLRCLVFYAAFYRFYFVSEHVHGVLNTAADAISRNNVSLFLSLNPQMPRRPIPQPVMDLLVTKRPDWGSKDWTTAFASSLIGGLQKQHERSTNQGGDTMGASAQNLAFPHYHLPSTPSAGSQQPSPSQ